MKTEHLVVALVVALVVVVVALGMLMPPAVGEVGAQGPTPTPTLERTRTPSPTTTTTPMATPAALLPALIVPTGAGDE